MDPILIVDDEKDNLDALRRLLRNTFDITTALSPFDALKLVQQQPFHVIISDQRMPEMTGVELLEKIKNIVPAAIRILLTGYTDIDSVIGAINRGNIYRYIAKPWDPDDLKLTLNQANEAFRLRQEVEKKNAELQTALSELKVLDQAKGRFLALVSHELNTPLTVIQSFIQLLSSYSKGLPKDIQPAVHAIQGAADRLNGIIGEVLTYVRMQSSSKVEWQEFSAGALIRKIIDELANSSIQLQGEANSSIKGDRQKLEVAFRCLIQDAVTRAPKGTSVVIELGKGSLTVTRQGPSLSAKDFDAFEVSDEAHHHQNLGLALATAKMIASLHGGEVKLEESTAKKTVVSLSVPLDKSG